MTIERFDPDSGIKVVPMYIEPDPDAIEPEAIEADQPVGAPRESRAKTPLVGIAASLAAVLTIAALVFAIVVAYTNEFVLSTMLAWAAIVLSVLAVGGGIFAFVTRRGRPWAVSAVVLGILANPVVLLSILQLASGLETR